MDRPRSAGEVLLGEAPVGEIAQERLDELRTQVAEVRTAYSSTAEAEKWVYKENKSLQKRLTEAKKTAMRWAMYKFMLEKEQRASSNKE